MYNVKFKFYRMKKVFIVLIGLVIGFGQLAKADEGMWVPMLINNNIVEMQKLGMKLSAEDIYSVNSSSLKDAIVIFGRGCTGEIISSKGLWKHSKGKHTRSQLS